MKLVDRVLERLEGVRERGGSYVALCPAHEDREPSLSVSEGEDRRVLLKCFAGCPTQEITDAIDLKMNDLFEQHNGRGEGGLLSPQNQLQPCNPAPSTPTPRRRSCRWDSCGNSTCRT